MLDLASKYLHLDVADQDCPKTAYFTNRGLYQFWVRPFGLCNAPAFFKRLMDAVLADLLGTGYLAFPVCNMEAKTVAEVVTQEIICRFGTPSE